MDKIQFWTTGGPYGCLSNFSQHPIIDLYGHKWFTSEALYQSYKFTSPNIRQEIRLAATPKLSKQVAHKYPIEVPNWDDVKYKKMLQVLLLKASQHPEVVLSVLYNTTHTIEEASPYDYIWGTGKDGSGQNLLGKAWMEVRALLCV